MPRSTVLVRTLVATGAAVAITATGLVAAGDASASSRITCTASASPKYPSQNSYVKIAVHTAASVPVRATAHYKTTNTSHSTTSNSRGNASIPFHISRATIGYKVTVSVTAQGPHNTATCSTSFTPR